MIEENDRSVLAESFRIMTTNLQYLLVNAKNEGKGYCIYTTSTVKGEGKTFTSINLAMTLANTGKKVILIGADLRNPQLQRYDTESKSAIGVSDYLVNEDHRLESLIHDSKFHPNLKLFLSGSIPPNPSELLRQSKFGRMIHELREQYDYVIVDTAPSMLVADTFLISKYADLILYVTRAGYTEKKFGSPVPGPELDHDQAMQCSEADLPLNGKNTDSGLMETRPEMDNFCVSHL